MKYILSILFLILSYVSFGNTIDTVPNNPLPTQYSTGFFRHGVDKSDSGHVERVSDTAFIPRWPGMKVVWQQVSDTSMWLWTGARWIKLLKTGDAGGSAIADSTGIGILYGDSATIYNAGVGGVYDSTIYAYPGDTLQRRLELVPEYGRLMIMPGLHVLPLDTLNSIMYVDRSNLTIEFAAGAYVKVKDSSNAIIDSVEINRNYGAINGLDDISAQTTIHPPIVNQSIQIQITSTGTPNQFTVSGASDGNGAYNIDGTFQAIGTTGIEVKFDATTGHTLNDLWWLVTSSTPASIVRIGEGFQTDSIKNTNVIGDGVLDGNVANQNTVNTRAHESNYTVGIFGRVKNTTISGVSIINSERSIMAAGRHTGTFNSNGSTTGGESFDVDQLRVLNVNSYDNTSGFLFGHPAYRGYQKNIFMSGCNVINNTSLATVEPNHRCDSFIITNNFIENKTGGSSLHLWRAPSNGKIFNNIIRGSTGDNAPTGWYRSFGLNNWADYDNNLFSLSQQNAISSSNNSNRIGLGTTTPTTKLQIVGPHVSGQGLLNVKGNSTVGFIVLNTTTAPGLAGLSFQSAGGAVGSVQGIGSDTTVRLFNDRFPCCPAITLYNNGNVNLGIPTLKPDVKLQVRDTASAPTNTIRTVAKFIYKWAGTTPSPFPGLGIGVEFAATNALSGSVPVTVGKIEFPYTDGTVGSEDADFVIKLIRAGALTEPFRITSTGAARFNNAFTFPIADGTTGQVLTTNGSGTVTWQAPATGITSINSQTQASQTLSVGNGMSVSSGAGTHTISIQPTFISRGTYTPTLTDISNLDGSSASANSSRYTQIDSMVTVYGKITVDPTTTATNTVIDVSLPIAASGLTDLLLSGVGVVSESGAPHISVNISGNTTVARLSFYANGTSSTGLSYTFSYKRD